MRKIFVFLSVMLLFIASLAHAPPVIDVGEDQNETVIKNSLDQPADAVNITATEIGEITLPLVFSISELPVQTTVIVESGMLDMRNYDDNTTLAQDAAVWNLIQTDISLYRSYENWLQLQTNLVERLTVTRLSRLDIGELFAETS